MTLDSFLEDKTIIGDYENYGLIKLDTQGSELLILEGASKFLSERKPKYILLEASVSEYNEGAPRIPEVLTYMQKIGYTLFDIFGYKYNFDGSLLQTDLFFIRS